MFVEAAEGWSGEDFRKARVGVHSSIAYGAIVIASCAAGLPVASDLWALLPSTLIGALATFGNPWLVKVTGRPLLAGRLLTCQMLVGLTYTAIVNGGATEHGLEGTSSPWLLVVPVLGALLVSGRFAYLAAAASAAHALAMWACFRLGVQFPTPNPGEAALSSAWSTATAIAFVVVVAVIAERNRAAATAARDAIAVELLEAQKLEAVGRLAAGVAHEINTPVQFVSDSIHFVQDAMADLQKLHQQLKALLPEGSADDLEAQADYAYLAQEIPAALKRSLEGLDRVTEIVRAMKAFARADQNTKAPIDLNSAVQSTLTISRGEYKLVADVTTEFGDLPPVTCHAGQINQVVLNLICNAAHAIADRVKGTDAKGQIAVRTSCEGDDAVIAITDTGTGIPEAVRGRIFEPFFTTKEVGKGSGQGLSICRALVKEHHGRLTFETEVGVGTTFFVRLPVGPSAHASAA